MKDSTKKRVAVGAGLAAAGGTAAALALRGKPLPRIGTPVSKVKVVKSGGKYAKQAVGRVVEASARLDAVLRHFEEITTEELPYGGGLCGAMDRPNFPSLYLSRSTNPALMNLPGEGTAMIHYKVKNRNVDESREDGQPLYGASIEVRSIEPMAGEEEDDDDGAELSETLYLREFGFKPRSASKLMKTSKLNPLKIGKTGVDGEFVVRPKMKLPSTAGAGYFTDDIRDARNTAAAILRKKRGESKAGLVSDWLKGKHLEEPLDLREFGGEGLGSLLKQADRSRKGVGRLMDAALRGNRGATMAFRRTKLKPIPMKQAKADGDFYARLVTNRGFGPADELRMKRHYIKKAVRSNMQLSERMDERLRHFSVARDRDGEGRFASGNIPGADDYAIAAQAAKKKQGMGLGKKVAIGAGVLGAGALGWREAPAIRRALVR